MKKALKIIDRLAKNSFKHTSPINVNQKDGKVTFETKENQVSTQIYSITFFLLPLVYIYFFRNFVDLFAVTTLVLLSGVFVFSYIRGSFQTDNRIIIDLNKEEIRINRKSSLGKLTRKNRVLKTQKKNKVLKEEILFSDSLDIRLTLQIDEEKIPLLDLKNDTISDQVLLSLNLLAKYEKIK